ncbi:MAG: TetR/AcrR family transcriptional regulator C-terminal domain-containing protein [Bacillota bacterium]|nr:TetR/AcrR family transcriptional regulator C-terminal domain-containing protein [Bacillota bacterium]
MDKIVRIVLYLNSGRRFMKPQNDDRRILRTRNSLRDALFSLMLEQKYDDIAIKTILHRANIGRSTFYLHYNDKEELLADSLDRLFEMLHHAQIMASPVEKHEKAIGFSLMMFQHAYESRDIYKNLVGSRGWDFVSRRIEDYIVQLIKEEVKPLFKKKSSSEITLDFFVYYLGSSFISVLTWWLNNSKSITPMEINNLFRKMVLPILAAHL